MALADRLKNPDKKYHEKLPPVWEGPAGTGPQGGVSQSLLGRFLCSPAHFKVQVIDGWRTRDAFSAPLECGNMWHVCEEAGPKWRDALTEYVHVLSDRYPHDREKTAHWHEMVGDLYPLYLDYWKTDPNAKGRTPLFREQVFDLPYRLPSGKVVRLRGKWDGLDLIKVPKSKSEDGLYLYENKTKSSIDQVKITRQLSFDLQTMFYIVALYEQNDNQGVGDSVPLKALYPDQGSAEHAIKGVYYNVVRRSAHKSADSMVKKVLEDIDDNRGGEWFGRWLVDISPHDVKVFKDTCLHPLLERLCVWWETVRGNLVAVNALDLRDMLHWRHPNGVYNPIDETGGSEVDEYLATGSTLGLERVTTLFPELEQ